MERLEFTFPDEKGSLHAFPAERYAGKVVLITVGGSWCPNCHDEAEFLGQLLADRRARGLEVIQLMFERTPDFESQAKAARDFAAKFAIDYPVLIAGTTYDDDVLKKLPQLAAFKAYPTLFVIDRKGVVRAVHTGYAGPATGAYHEEQERELTALVDALWTNRPDMPSFDVVSEVDSHELANAVDQANREVSQRFDFRDTGANFELADHLIILHAQVDFQLKQMLDILKLKLAKRGIDVVCLEPGESEIALNAAKQQLVLRHGIDAESGRKLQRLLKDSKLKIQASIQGDQLRVTGKQRDDLQAAMALLRKAGLDRPLQFRNFRD